MHFKILNNLGQCVSVYMKDFIIHMIVYWCICETDLNRSSMMGIAKCRARGDKNLKCEAYHQLCVLLGKRYLVEGAIATSFEGKQDQTSSVKIWKWWQTLKHHH